jgi:hypothetical protein
MSATHEIVAMAKNHPLRSAFVDQQILPYTAEIAYIANRKWYEQASEFVIINSNKNPKKVN